MERDGRFRKVLLKLVHEPLHIFGPIGHQFGPVNIDDVFPVATCCSLDNIVGNGGCDGVCT